MKITESKTFTAETLAAALMALEMSGKKLSLNEQAEWLIAYTPPRPLVRRELFPTVFGDI